MYDISFEILISIHITLLNIVITQNRRLIFIFINLSTSLLLYNKSKILVLVVDNTLKGISGVRLDNRKV